MRRNPRTHRLAARIAATAVIALAPLAFTAAPALADPAAPAPGVELEDASRPGRHGHGHGHGWNNGRHNHGNRSWNGGFDDHAGWDRGHRNRHRHGNGWNNGRGHGHGHGNGWNPGYGLPLPWFLLPGTGSAF